MMNTAKETQMKMLELLLSGAKVLRTDRLFESEKVKRQVKKWSKDHGIEDPDWAPEIVEKFVNDEDVSSDVRGIIKKGDYWFRYDNLSPNETVNQFGLIGKEFDSQKNVQDGLIYIPIVWREKLLVFHNTINQSGDRNNVNYGTQRFLEVKMGNQNNVNYGKQGNVSWSNFSKKRESVLCP